MPLKLFAAAVAVILVIAFLAPMVLKLKQIALGVIILIGIGMMLADLWQSLQSEED